MKLKKNVLLITVNKIDGHGGVATYNKKLIEIIEKNFKDINIDILLPGF
ncbi:hypothetical protein J6P11_05495 [bacterium]|nr:hypothetical protein [bacterium]